MAAIYPHYDWKYPVYVCVCVCMCVCVCVCVCDVTSANRGPTYHHQHSCQWTHSRYLVTAFMHCSITRITITFDMSQTASQSDEILNTACSQKTYFFMHCTQAIVIKISRITPRFRQLKTQSIYCLFYLYVYFRANFDYDYHLLKDTFSDETSSFELEVTW